MRQCRTGNEGWPNPESWGDTEEQQPQCSDTAQTFPTLPGGSKVAESRDTERDRRTRQTQPDGLVRGSDTPWQRGWDKPCMWGWSGSRPALNEGLGQALSQHSPNPIRCRGPSWSGVAAAASVRHRPSSGGPGSKTRGQKPPTLPAAPSPTNLARLMAAPGALRQQRGRGRTALPASPARRGRARGAPAAMAAYLTHQQKVLRLYKKSLRHLESWCIHR